MKIPKWIWISLVLFGIGFRCIALTSRSIQYDDAFSILLAEQSYTNIILGTAADTMPPLFYLLLHLWMQLGQSIWFVRLFSVVISAITLVVFALCIRDMFDDCTATFSLFFASISALQIYHAQDIRMYALAQLFLVFYLWMAFRINRHDTQKYISEWIILIMSGILALYTHPLTIFVILIPILFFVIRKNWKKLLNLLFAQLIIGFVFLPWLQFLPGQFEKVQTAFWTPKPGLVEIIQILMLWVSGLPLPRNLLIIGILVTVLAVILMIYILIRHAPKDRHLIDLLTIIILPPTLCFISSFFMQPIFIARGFLISSLFFYGLLGYILSRGKELTGKILLTGCFLIGSVITLPYQYQYEYFPRSPYSDALRFIDERIQINDIVIHDNKLSYFPSYIYFRNLPQVFLADEPGSPNDTLAYATQFALGIFPQSNIFEAVDHASNIYFIVFQETELEFENRGIYIHPVLNWLCDQYDLVDIQSFNDLNIYIFQTGFIN